MTQLSLDCLGQMAFAGKIFDQDHFPGSDDPGFTIAHGDPVRSIEVDEKWGKVVKDAKITVE